MANIPNISKKAPLFIKLHPNGVGNGWANDALQQFVGDQYGAWVLRNELEDGSDSMSQYRSMAFQNLENDLVETLTTKHGWTYNHDKGEILPVV